MAFPLLLALSMAASGLGSALNSRAENKNRQREQDAVNGVMERNRIKQQRFAEQAKLDLQNTREKFTRENQEQKREENEDTRSKKLKSAVKKDIGFEGVPASAPKNVVVAANKAGAEAGATGDRDAQNLAALSAWSDLGLDNQLALQRGRQNLAFTQDAAQGQQRLVPIEVQAARMNAKKKSSGLGTLLQLAGAAGSMYAGGQGQTLASLFGGGGGPTGPQVAQFGANGNIMSPY